MVHNPEEASAGGSYPEGAQSRRGKGKMRTRTRTAKRKEGGLICEHYLSEVLGGALLCACMCVCVCMSAVASSCSAPGSKENSRQQQPLSGDPSQPSCGFTVQPEPTDPPQDPCLHGQQILDPDPVVRTSGPPNTQAYTIDAPGPGWICVRADTSRVAAARIAVDGLDLVTPDRFRPQVTQLTERAEVSAGAHDLSVRLASTTS